MTKKIIQKVCGFAVSAAMALSSIAGPVADVWAEDSAALAGAGAEENIQPEQVPVLYRITLPWTEHLIIEPEKDHIYIPDPDMRTEEEMKDILLTYEAGEEVEIGIRPEDTWQITKMSFLDDQKEESGYEWKDQTTVHFYMPEKNLLMKAELTEIEIPEPAPQDASADTDLSQQAGAEVDLSLQGEALPEEPQAGAVDPAASPAENAVQNTDDEASVTQDTSAADASKQNAGEETGYVQEDSALAESAPETIQKPAEGSTGAEEGTSAGEGEGNGNVTETEPPMTYIPEKDADGLPVQGSIEQTETLEIVRNDAGFDAKIDLRNVPYDPEQYSIEYISDDILPDTPGTYSCIYKVTAPDSGKFFFVLRPVKVVEAQNLAAALSDQAETEMAAESDAQETVLTEAGSGQQTETQTTETPESIMGEGGTASAGAAGSVGSGGGAVTYSAPATGYTGSSSESVETSFDILSVSTNLVAFCGGKEDFYQACFDYVIESGKTGVIVGTMSGYEIDPEAQKADFKISLNTGGAITGTYDKAKNSYSFSGL